MSDIIENISWTLTVIGGLFAIFLLLWKIFGNSPTLGEISLGLTFLLAPWVVNFSTKVARSEGRFQQYEKNIKDSFDKVKEDSKELKEESKKIREDLLEIKQRLRREKI